MTVAADRIDLVRQLAHEMQAPITSLELQVRALKDQCPGNDLAESCLIEIESMKRLLTSFLELDGPALEPVPTQLAPVLGAIRARFRPIADNAGLELHMDGEELAALCDRRATERILSNLVDNAIKFSAADGRVRVNARAVSGKIEIEVRDNGIGIAGGARAHVFEPFYRVDRQTPGSGLGLAICQRLARAQRGTLRCESELGRGSSFLLTLPAA